VDPTLPDPAAKRRDVKARHGSAGWPEVNNPSPLQRTAYTFRESGARQMKRNRTPPFSATKSQKEL